MEEWHRLEVSEVLEKLNTDPENGLTVMRKQKNA
jgi:hypothetical protein